MCSWWRARRMRIANATARGADASVALCLVTAAGIQLVTLQLSPLSNYFMTSHFHSLVITRGYSTCCSWLWWSPAWRTWSVSVAVVAANVSSVIVSTTTATIRVTITIIRKYQPHAIRSRNSLVIVKTFSQEEEAAACGACEMPAYVIAITPPPYAFLTWLFRCFLGATLFLYAQIRYGFG